MLASKAEGMTCAHSAAVVRRAIRAVDPGNRVMGDRSTDRVAVETAAVAEAVQRAIVAEGYVVKGRA